MLGASVLLCPEVPFAAEGPKLSPAEFKPLPVGTKVKYDTWTFTVEEVDNFDFLIKINDNRWLRRYAVFGKYGSYAYSKSRSGNTEIETELDDAAKKALESLWP